MSTRPYRQFLFSYMLPTKGSIGDITITISDDSEPLLNRESIDCARDEIRRSCKVANSVPVIITFIIELDDEERYELTEAGKAKLKAELAEASKAKRIGGAK